MKNNEKYNMKDSNKKCDGTSYWNLPLLIFLIFAFNYVRENALGWGVSFCRM